MNAGAVTAATATPEIHVTPAAVDRGPATPAPKKGSAQDRMFSDLRKQSGVEEEQQAPAKPTETPEEAPGNETPPVEPKGEVPTGESPTTSEQKKKISPWKLVDEHKAARLKAETEAAELRKTMLAPEKAKELQTKVEQYEKRAKELEDHIAFVDYKKSQEFHDKYQKPYDEAWAKHMGELGELMVTDTNGQSHPLSPADLLELVNSPLQKARDMAEEKFGSFANDVMDARKEIRSLFESQQKALTEAEKMGADRIKQFQEQSKAQQEAMHKEIATIWQESNKAVTEDPNYGKFFKPVEGDEEGNTRLQKGYEMADRAFSVNPNTPGLTPDQRSEVVRLHSAIRNRAAGFGRLAYQNQQLETKIATLTEELNKYKGTEPGAGTPKTTEQNVATSARDSVFAELRKYAH